MKTREEWIAFEMNYCRHYERGKGAEMVCAAGMDIKSIKKVPAGPKGIKWGPCIEGHSLENPIEHCPKWERHTREDGEKRADEIERSIQRIEVVMPLVAQWRRKAPLGKQEVVPCPICKGHLHLSQSSYNGHVRGACETPNCVSWIE